MRRWEKLQSLHLGAMEKAAFEKIGANVVTAFGRNGRKAVFEKIG